jgi:hypothetical protein
MARWDNKHDSDRRVISPLLDRMEGFFARTENKPIESLRELEDQLSARFLQHLVVGPKQKGPASLPGLSYLNQL